MGILRHSDSVGLVPVRGNRFFKLHNYWFFATREGAAVGPFDSKELASKGVRDYIEFANTATNSAMRFFTTGTQFAV